MPRRTPTSEGRNGSVPLKGWTAMAIAWKILAAVGLLFWVYCAANAIQKRRAYLSIGEGGRVQLGVWAVFILIGCSLSLWVLLR
jgi:hypothetical protein